MNQEVVGWLPAPPPCPTNHPGKKQNQKTHRADKWFACEAVRKEKSSSERSAHGTFAAEHGEVDSKVAQNLQQSRRSRKKRKGRRNVARTRVITSHLFFDQRIILRSSTQTDARTVFQQLREYHQWYHHHPHPHAHVGQEVDQELLGQSIASTCEPW